MEDQRPLGVDRMSRLFVTPGEVSSTWVCKSHWRGRPQWPDSLDHLPTKWSGPSLRLQTSVSPALALVLWAFSDFRLISGSFSNDWRDWLFESETAERWFYFFQNPWDGTHEMAGGRAHSLVENWKTTHTKENSLPFSFTSQIQLLIKCWYIFFIIFALHTFT